MGVPDMRCTGYDVGNHQRTADLARRTMITGVFGHGKADTPSTDGRRGAA
jgi:hypothetical protein